MVTVKASAGGEMEMVDVTVMVTNVVELGMLTADMDSPINYMENGTDDRGNLHGSRAAMTPRSIGVWTALTAATLCSTVRA